MDGIYRTTVAVGVHLVIDGPRSWRVVGAMTELMT
jgi:hypothetical protein